jgi:hypothetical protein
LTNAEKVGLMGTDFKSVPISRDIKESSFWIWSPGKRYKGETVKMFKLIIGFIVIYLLFKLIRKSPPEVGGNSGPARIKTPVDGEELVEDPIFVPGNVWNSIVKTRTLVHKFDYVLSFRRLRIVISNEVRNLDG